MIIGLTGYKGSGKSEVARHLATRHRYTRKPFAYHLKAMLSALGVPAEVLDGNDEMKSKPLDVLGGHTARHAMQTLGTEWGRAHLGSDFWVMRWLDSVPLYPYIVADDVRFENEAAAVRMHGGVVVLVENPRLAVSSDKHVSENIIRDPDYCIVNSGTIEDLWRKVDDMLAELSGDKYPDEDAEGLITGVDALRTARAI